MVKIQGIERADLFAVMSWYTAYFSSSTTILRLLSTLQGCDTCQAHSSPAQVCNTTHLSQDIIG